MNSPGQNGSRERGFGTLTYERLYIDEIDDAVMLAKRAEEYRIEYNQIRPHEAIAWNRPKDVHLGLADPPSRHFKPPKPCQLLDAGHYEESVLYYNYLYPSDEQSWNGGYRWATCSVFDPAGDTTGTLAAANR